MSQVLIQQYLNHLQDLRKVSGTHRESVAYKDGDRLIVDRPSELRLDRRELIKMLPDGIGSDTALSTTSGMEGSKNLGGDSGVD